jgi:hypothetical protein
VRLLEAEYAATGIRLKSNQREGLGVAAPLRRGAGPIGAGAFTRTPGARARVDDLPLQEPAPPELLLFRAGPTGPHALGCLVSAPVIEEWDLDSAIQTHDAWGWGPPGIIVVAHAWARCGSTITEPFLRGRQVTIRLVDDGTCPPRTATG